MWMPIKGIVLNFNAFDIVMDIRELKRLRRKARRFIVPNKQPNVIRGRFEYLDGKLYYFISSNTLINYDQHLEFFRRMWILQEVKQLRGLKAFSGK